MGADAVVVRHRASGAPHRLATSGWITGTVVNAGDGTHEHPTQALLDAFTMRRRLRGRRSRDLDGLPGHDRRRRPALAASPAPTCCCCDTLGADVTLVAPPTLLPVGVDDAGRARRPTTWTGRCPRATSVMMLRVQRERMNAAFFPSAREYSRRYGLDGRADGPAPDHAIVMHPGPMNRGMEIAAEVADSPRSTIVEQVTNGVSVRMAVLYLLLGRSAPTERSGMMSAYLVTRRRLARRATRSTSLLDDGVDRRGRARAVARAAPRSSTPTGWSRCPASSTCTRTCASPAARTPRPSRPAPLPPRSAASPRCTPWPTPTRSPTRPASSSRSGGSAARPGTATSHPVGAVTVGLRGRAARRARRDGRLGRPGAGLLRRRHCVSDAVLMRRALEYVKAFGGVVAQHAQEPRLTEDAQMNEGELSGVLGLTRLAGGRRGGDHRPRRAAHRARRLAAARLPRVHRRLGRDPALGQGARAGTSPPR